MTIRNGLRWIEKRKQWRDSTQTARERKERERGREGDWQLHAARCFFASSMSGSKALYSARFLSTRWIDTRQKRRNAACLCTRPSISFSCLCPSVLRPSFVYMRRVSACRVAWCTSSWIGPVIARLIFQSFFSRHSVRFSERGRSCPSPFIAHLSSCACRLFAMRRSKVAKRVHSCISRSDPSISPPSSFFLVPRTHMRLASFVAIFFFTSLYACIELQSIKTYTKRIISFFFFFDIFCCINFHVDWHFSFFYNC